MLLDIHPEPVRPRIEVHHANRITDVGLLDTSTNVAKVVAARATLSSVVEAGYFARVRATTFEFLYHFDSVENWLEYMADRWSDATIGPAIASRARRLLRREPGELVIREQVLAARLEKVVRPPGFRPP